jgi:hypothetical protein
MKSSDHTLNLHVLNSCTLLQLRTSRDCLLPRTDSSPNRTNSVTYVAEERTRITGNMSRDHPPLRDVTVDTENTASSIVACWAVFTELLPGNSLIKSVTIHFHIVFLSAPKSSKCCLPFRFSDVNFNFWPSPVRGACVIIFGGGNKLWSCQYAFSPFFMSLPSS